MKIGIIGIGNVGYPLYKALQYYHEKDTETKQVFCYDIKKPCDKWKDIIDTDIVFICVPTDSKSDGRLDMTLVGQNLLSLKESKYKGLVVIKSTLGLGYIGEIIKRYPFRIIVFPEWLYAVNAFPDTVKPEMTVVGVNNPTGQELGILFGACKWHKIEDAYIVKPEEAVMIKLTANSLAATKISFANQIQLICEEYNIDSNKIMDVIKHDPRCSPRYLTPGRPYGGHCLPKDTNELINCISDTYLFEGMSKVNQIFKERNESGKSCVK